MILFSGWGKYSLEGVELQIYSTWSCRQFYGNKTVMTSNLFCAGAHFEKKTTCEGDDGSPFLVRIPPWKKWHVIGIASQSDNCGKNREPSLFTRISGFESWINKQIDVRYFF